MYQVGGVFQLLGGRDFHGDKAGLGHGAPEADELAIGGGGSVPSRMPCII
jgi:hypothetical protein